MLDLYQVKGNVRNSNTEEKTKEETGLLGRTGAKRNSNPKRY
jgi:hypothetical protein